MNGRIALGGLLVCFVALSGNARGEGEEAQGLPDSEVGLRGVSVFEEAVPPAVKENASDPGEAALPARVNDELPPVVPHGVADFLPITRSSNACVDCHAIEEREPGEPTPLPESHYRDLRNAPDQVGEAVAGARYVCVSCHVVPTEAAPLVANPFYDTAADAAAPASEKKPPVEP